MQIRAMFSKEKLNDADIIQAVSKVFHTDKEDILIIENSSGWIDRNNQNFVIQYNGVIDDEEEDEYIGLHYYDINFEDEKYLEMMEQLGEELNMLID